MAKRKPAVSPGVQARLEGRIETAPNRRLISNAPAAKVEGQMRRRVVASTLHPTLDKMHSALGAGGRRQATPGSYEATNYGGNANSLSDIERLRAGGGLATGRTSPKIPHRTNAASATLVDRKLAAPGDVDPNQGRLLSHAQMGEITRTDRQTSYETGVPSNRPAGKGWLTGVGKTATNPFGTSAEARAAGNLRAAKYIGERKAGTSHTKTGKPKSTTIGTAAKRLGTQDPTVSALTERAKRETNKEPFWYAGHSRDVIQNEANKSGVDFNTARRVTAMLSPQKPWQTGHPQDSNMHLPNAEVAGSLIRHHQDINRQYAPASTVDVAETHRMPSAAHGGGPEQRGQSVKMLRSAAKSIGQTTHTPPGLITEAQKVVNFDQALNAGHPTSRWINRQAAQAYTSDTHDVKSMGDKDYRWVGNPSSGGYEFAAMTGRRASMRQGVRARATGSTPRTPSEYQENIWESQKGPAKLRSHLVGEHEGSWEKGKQALFETRKGSTKLTASPLALPYQEPKHLSPHQFRESTPEDDEEF